MTIIPQPGSQLDGTAALLDWLASFAKLEPEFKVPGREIIASGHAALHTAGGTLQGTGPQGEAIGLAGRTADVLRRQADGGWPIAIDTPWGTALLDN